MPWVRVILPERVVEALTTLGLVGYHAHVRHTYRYDARTELIVRRTEVMVRGHLQLTRGVYFA